VNEIIPITFPSSRTGNASSSWPRRNRSSVCDRERSAGTAGGGGSIASATVADARRPSMPMRCSDAWAPRKMNIPMIPPQTAK
jgi:hypothetical protein